MRDAAATARCINQQRNGQPGELVVEIKQKRFSNRTHFSFGEESLDHRIEDGSGSRAFSVAYRDISRDRQTLEERNQWLGNVGLLWIVLGVVFTAMSYFGEGPFRVSYWLWIGLGCWGFYKFRRTRFTLVPTEKGNLCVIDDADGPGILQQIESRRAAGFRQYYDFLDPAETPQQQESRYRWLHREGALSEQELRQRLSMIETPAMQIEDASTAAARRSLN